MVRYRDIYQTVNDHWLFLLATSVGFTLFYYAGLLLLMMLKFREFPNYFTVYDWTENVAHIVKSTPSVADTIMIIKAEWLLEIGYMNYEFGLGIAEWSLYISPAKAIAVMLLGMLLALLLMLARSVAACTSAKKSTVFVGGIGALLASLSLMSLSWVVCCATPTWIVGLAILGLGVSTSLWLEPAGIWLNLIGFMALSLAIVTLARTSPQPRESHQAVQD
ncbi:MAG TPA: hypothetical protein VLE50_05740 [Cellvibrio sp.]|nr:hypothetical protein [Cellvibrio sp.]